MPPTIPTLAAAALTPGAISSALAEAGAVVVTGMSSPATVAVLDTELSPYFDATRAMREIGEAEFYAGDTKRLPNLLSKSPAVAAMCADGAVLEALDGTLLPHCENYQLHVCSALNIGPGARAQVLHREDAWDENIREWAGEAEKIGPKRALIVATMWATTPFTAQVLSNFGNLAALVQGASLALCLRGAGLAASCAPLLLLRALRQR